MQLLEDVILLTLLPDCVCCGEQVDYHSELGFWDTELMSLDAILTLHSAGA